MTNRSFSRERLRGRLHIAGRVAVILLGCFIAVVMLAGAWGWAHKVQWDFCGAVCR